MDEELDLQPYMAALRRYWFLPVAGLVGAALLAAIISIWRGPVYSATATVLVPTPAYQWRFDAAIQTVADPKKDLRDDLLALARTPAIAERALALLENPATSGGQSAPAMLGAVQFTKAGTSVITVQATAGDPATAAAVANAWADALVPLASQLILQGADPKPVQAELDAAQARLAEVDKAYERFKAETGIDLRMGGGVAVEEGRLFSGDSLAKHELLLRNSELAEYRQALAHLRLLIQKAEQTRQAGGRIDSLPLELLHTRLLEERGQVMAQDLRAQTSWDGLLAKLRAEEAALAETEAALSADAIALQDSIARQYTELNDLERQRAILTEVVYHLNRKIEELTLQQRFDPMGVQVASYATVPERPAGLGLLIVMALAGLLGLGMGVLLALLRHSLRST